MMLSWFKDYMPSLHKFFVDSFSALNNKKEGYSLKKLMSVGFFGLSAYCVLRYTTIENVTTVLAILTAMITALIITNSVSVHSTDKLNKDPSNEQK